MITINEVREMRKEIEIKEELISYKKARAFVEALDEPIRKAVNRKSFFISWSENQDIEEIQVLEKAKEIFQENGFKFSWKEQHGIIKFFVEWEY